MEADPEQKKDTFEPKHDPIFEFKLELQQSVTKAKTLCVALYGKLQLMQVPQASISRAA